MRDPYGIISLVYWVSPLKKKRKKEKPTYTKKSLMKMKITRLPPAEHTHIQHKVIVNLATKAIHGVLNYCSSALSIRMQWKHKCWGSISYFYMQAHGHIPDSYTHDRRTDRSGRARVPRARTERYLHFHSGSNPGIQSWLRQVFELAPVPHPLSHTHNLFKRRNHYVMCDAIYAWQVN